MSDTSCAQSELTIACIQMEPIVGAKQANVVKSLEWIGQAALNGARLIVLPELANSGYVVRDRAEAFELAEEVPTGETSTAWVDAARHHDVYIVAGIAERAGTTLYNSAILLGPPAHTNSMFIACADRVGSELEQLFQGQSVIVSCTEWLLRAPRAATAKKSSTGGSIWRTLDASATGTSSIKFCGLAAPTSM